MNDLNAPIKVKHLLWSLAIAVLMAVTSTITHYVATQGPDTPPVVIQTVHPTPEAK